MDFLDRSLRFNLMYNFYNYKNHTRVLTKKFLSLFQKPKTLSKMVSAADFAEREIYDMFGITFIGHLDLRRILTDYGFDGHPLKKDYPVTGYYQIRYSILEKALIFQKLHLAQAFRMRVFTSTEWEML